jgi:hypothetical protein
MPKEAMDFWGVRRCVASIREQPHICFLEWGKHSMTNNQQQIFRGMQWTR